MLPVRLARLARETGIVRALGVGVLPMQRDSGDVSVPTKGLIRSLLQPGELPSVRV